MTAYERHFADVAGSYDVVRHEETDAVANWVTDAGALRPGLHLLDVGCGTGVVTCALAERAGVTAVGVDPSAEMLQQAQRRAGERCSFVRADAEQLPFAHGSFERVLMQGVIHLVDRAAALGEARRVLTSDGALVIHTPDPVGVDDYWLGRWFPSFASIERTRFPSMPALAEELRAAGFARVEVSRLRQRVKLDRDHALALLRARYPSFIVHISEHEYERALANAERDMPDATESDLHLACVVGWI